MNKKELENELVSERARRDEFRKWLDGQCDRFEKDCNPKTGVFKSCHLAFDEVFGRAGEKK